MSLLLRRLICIKLLFICCFSFGQQKMSIEKLFDLVEKHYDDVANYSYKMDYSFYENEKATKAIESYEGMVLKFNNVKYQKINKVEFVDFGDKNVMLNHEDKLIQISQIENDNSPILIKTFLTLFPVHKITEEETQFVCTLSNEKMNQTNIKKLIIFINKNDFSLQKEQFVYFGENEVVKGDQKIKINNPKLEISFIPRTINTNQDGELIKRSNYYNLQSNKVVTSNKYKTYKLIVY